MEEAEGLDPTLSEQDRLRKERLNDQDFELKSQKSNQLRQSVAKSKGEDVKNGEIKKAVSSGEDEQA